MQSTLKKRSTVTEYFFISLKLIGLVYILNFFINHNSYKAQWVEQNLTCTFMPPEEQNHTHALMTPSELASALNLLPFCIKSKMKSFLYGGVGH